MANSVVTRVAKVLLAGGFNKTAAAGVIGNAFGESSWNPASVGSGGGGLWGFTAHPMSLGDLQNYAAAHGEKWTDPEVQARFLLKNTTKSQIQAMNAQKTARAAAPGWISNWEKPLTPAADLPIRADK